MPGGSVPGKADRENVLAEVFNPAPFNPFPMENTDVSRSRRDFLARSLAAAGGLALPLSAAPAGDRNPLMEFDIVIYGGSSAAITAAVQARRMGRTVVIVCPDQHLGGLTTSGLGWTDSKNGNAIGGLAREFYHRVWLFYRNPAAWTRQTRASYLAQKVGAQPGPAIDEARQVMWTFEPKAAERVMEEWLSEAGVPVFRNEWLDRKSGVTKEGKKIVALKTLSGKVFRGRMFIDAGYEGDLMAAAGVRYRVGRDSAKEFDEPLNGIRFPVKGVDRYVSDGEYAKIDPYIVPGKPESGLLPGIEAEIKGPLPLGEADTRRLQSFNYRLCLTQDPANRVPFPKPADYDERDFELLFRIFETGGESSFTTQAMPNRKTDSNNQGRMSGDFIGGSFSIQEGWTYSDASYERRRQVVASHQRYHKGLLWSLLNHPRVPEKHREALAAWGLSRDEFADNGNWPYQLYVREARRMVGQTMVTQHHVQMKPGFEVKDPIGMGSYSLDSHVVRRIVVDGKIRGEGGFYIWWDRPYPLPYGCIVPQKSDVTNLFAPTTLSATHAAFGSIRMEPTYMILGQASATAAVLALEQNVDVQDVRYAALAKRLSDDRQVLALDVPGTPDPSARGRS
jgi:hypothetical protein